MSLTLALLLAAAAADPTTLDSIHVSARAPRAAAAEAVSAARLDSIEIARIAPQHAQELFVRIPGTWASRGSGQEQLLAIRSPVLAGTGACGAFLVLEQGIPIRPTGFCNVNQLFELPLELAGAVEVLRGPGTAVHGSNALHGVIELRAPALDAPAHARLSLGSFDYAQVILGLPGGSATRPLRIDASATDSGSFRVDEGYTQQRVLAQLGLPEAPGAPEFLLSAQRLDQDTAGYITGERAYADARRRLNPNPEAYRQAESARLSGRWRFALEAGQMALTPYARSDRGEFIQHFILGKPLETNGSDSLGLQTLWSSSNGALRLGSDIEFAQGRLLETQPMPLGSGTPAQIATRPAGRHYDYRVRSDSAALFAQFEQPLGARWSLQSGARIESIGYRYDNRMAAGNLREDGSECGFGGCLFQRPADRNDRFTRPTANLGLLRLDEAGRRVFLRAASAFRAPQVGELYRLQRGQAVADLGAERAQSIELGVGLPLTRGSLDAVVYHLDKRGSILRDSQGFNIGAGASRHQGIELDLRLRLPLQIDLAANLAWSDQRYRFDRALGGGETIRHGARVDTAPEWLGGLRLLRRFDRIGELELEWQHQGGYFADAGNTFFQPGHDLLNLRLTRALSAGWSLSAAIRNLGDIGYAERADFGFGERRFFPGAPRSYLLSLDWRG
ncbi:TonB-dependent receptor [Aquimonas sp.]|uniref:TonB-dependent receptor n=1 Tax=Aquimonas sp. TaxID=1872588 RepID=UPI0037BF96D9